MRLSGVDLNLLVVLDALSTERHVTRAARRVGLSQSAASHALGRLRELLGDPLFVRSGAGVRPTARAEALREPVRRALEAAEAALVAPARFDPATARRSFRIAAGDLVAHAILPPLATLVANEAPGVDLDVVGLGERSVVDALTRSDVDLVLGPVRGVDRHPSLREAELYEEGFVCVLRRGHPLARRGKLTLAAYCAAAHALVSPRGQPGGIVDDELARRGLARRVALRVPHFLVAPYVVAESDLLLALPERVARALSRDLPVVLRRPPLAVPRFTIAMVWHERLEDDPAHRFLRACVAKAARGLRAPLGARPRAGRARARAGT